MNASRERTVSYWTRSTPAIGAPVLDHDERADTVIVGAGIAGLSVAYELTLAGQSIVVLDRGEIGGGMTGRTTAHLASAFDDYYHQLIAARGVSDAVFCRASHAAAIDRIEEISGTEPVDCDFRRVDGYLFSAPGVDPLLLDREAGALREVGFDDFEWVRAAPLPGINTGPCLRLPRQGRFHPLRYLAGLADAVRRRGGRLYAGTAAVEFHDEAAGVVVLTERGNRVVATDAVIASNAPVNNRLAVHTKQAPYRTYVVAASAPKGAIEDALYWDTLDSYHYVRLQPAADGTDVLIVGGEDHKTGHAQDAEARFARLEGWMRTHFPQVGAVTDRWSGQVQEPFDGLGFIGRNGGDSHTFIASGDSGQGMTHGVIAGMLLRDLILGRDSPWAALYDPRRTTVRALGELAKETLDVAGRLAEHLTSGEVSSVAQLAPGQGAVVRQGLAKVAVFRDESGAVHARSATCTHAGCVVHWNPTERCWDCPCHGSHFAIDGAVLMGPATRPLSPVDIETPATPEPAAAS